MAENSISSARIILWPKYHAVVSEPDHRYLEILGPTSQYLEHVCAFITCRFPEDLSGEVKQSGFKYMLYSDSGFRRTVKEQCYCH